MPIEKKGETCLGADAQGVVIEQQAYGAEVERSS
jgi:hypothetical protein